MPQQPTTPVAADSYTTKVITIDIRDIVVTS